MTPFTRSPKESDPSAQNKRRLAGLTEFKRVTDYIDAHLTTPLTLEELAALLHLHPTYFSNRFAAVFGLPPMRYINRKRIERAQVLLLKTRHSMEQVAFTTGFQDIYYFSRMFKKVTGIAPADIASRAPSGKYAVQFC